MWTNFRHLGLAAAVTGLLAGAAPARAEDITLTYSDWQLAQTVWGRSLQEAFTEFQAENPGIKIRTEPVPLAQRDVRFTTAIRAGRGPDVFALDANPVRQYVAEGWVRDLTSYIAKEGPEYLKDFYPKTLEPVTVGGKTWGIPKNTVAMVMVYNERLYKQAGIAAPPATWEEFREVAAKLTGKDRWAFTLVLAPAGFDLRVSSVFRSFGADFLTPDWKHSAVNTPEMRKAFNYVLDMIASGVVPPGVAQVDANGARRLLANEQIAMAIDSTWTLPEVSDMNPKLDGWNVLKMAPIPVPAGTNPKVRTTLYEKSLFINKNTPHPDAAWKLIKFMTDDKRMRKWFDDNAMLSTRISVNQGYDKIAKADYANLVAGQIAEGDFLPLIPEWPEIQETFRQNLQAAVAGTKTRDQALTDAHTAIEAILARNPSK